jgi:hypothetical protein
VVAAAFLQAPQTLGDKSSAAQIEGYEQLFNVMILASLAIAGCALAAGVADGLADRKRPFSRARPFSSPHMNGLVCVDFSELVGRRRRSVGQCGRLFLRRQEPQSCDLA